MKEFRGGHLSRSDTELRERWTSIASREVRSESYNFLACSFCVYRLSGAG